MEIKLYKFNLFNELMFLIQKKYIISLTNSIQTAITYRFSFFIGAFTMIIPFIIKNYIWDSAITYSDNSTISGYTVNSIIIYNALAMIFGNLIRTNVQYEVAYEIKDGGLNRYLVQPINHMKYWLSKFIGKKCIDMLNTLVFGIILFIYLSDVVISTINYDKTIITSIVLILGLVLNFLLYYIISLSAFWFLEVSSFFTAINFVIMFLSGEIIPLDVLPNSINRILEILPFAYSVYFPIEILLNRVDTNEVIFKIVIQLLWIVILLLVAKGLWFIGIKRYEAIGG